MSSTLTCSFARRGRSARPVHPAALASLVAPATCHHGRLQSRSYRFGRLSSYFVHYISPDVYTRGKPPGYNKYCDNLYRRRSCDPHSLAEDAKATLKRVVNSYWHPEPADGQRADRCRNREASARRTPDNPEGVRPGRNIEDVERAPLEHFLFGDKKDSSAQKQDSSNEPPAASTQQVDDSDYVIDPISNRKVPRKLFESGYYLSEQEVEIPVKTFESYKPQFEAFRAPETENTKASSASESGSNEIQGDRHNDESSTPPEPEWLYKPSASARTDGKQVEDKPLNEPSTGFTGSGTAEHQESRSKDQAVAGTPEGWKELGRYGSILSREPDSTFAQEAPAAPDPAELDAYRKPFLADEPYGKYATSYGWPECSEDELAKYRHPFFCHEPDGRYVATYTEPQRDKAELPRHEAVRSHEPDGKYAKENASPIAPDDLQTYQAFYSHEPDGKYAAEAAASAKEAEDTANHEAFGYDETETRRLSEERQKKRGFTDSEGQELPEYDQKAESPASYAPREEYGATGSRESRAETGDELMARSAAEPAAAVDAQPLSEEPTRTQRYWTGNYVQDLPEDFSKSWTSEIATSTSSELSPEQDTSGEALQPALDRFNTSTASHKTDKATPAASTQPPSPSPDHPALYKILVYDPTMQCIHTAETTSIVPDSAAPLTPAEVLLRISNPAKFFPHFAPLQAEGFEIVSGSGDVLIFRKVREGVASKGDNKDGAESSTTTTTTSSSSKPASGADDASAPGPAAPSINPIDMTGEPHGAYSVSALRFSSPTGFVNYDLPLPRSRAEDGAEGESGGGGKSRQLQQQRQRQQQQREDSDWAGEKRDTGSRGKSLPHKIAMGAASLAGGAYAIGVVSEYFRGRGKDGKESKRP